MTLRLPDSGAEVMEDGRRLTPSARRNVGPILDAVRSELPQTGRVLEIASGSGLHAAMIAEALPGLDWQPSDVDPGCFRSIEAWAAQSAGRIRPPVAFDVTQEGWTEGLGTFDATLSVNLLHLIPEAGAATYLAGLPKILTEDGVALIYGPFLRDGQATSPGDVAFDANLRSQNPAIGYKDLAWVEARLTEAGFGVARHVMPANNLLVVARNTHSDI